MEGLKKIIEASYGLKIRKVVKHPGGFQNDIYFLQTSSKRFTLRVYKTENIEKEDLDFQFDVLQFLVRCKLPVQTPILSVSGEKAITFRKNRICQLLTFLEGESSFPIGVGRIKSSGELLGRIHSCTRNFNWDLYPKKLLNRRRWRESVYTNKINKSRHSSKTIPQKWRHAANLEACINTLLEAEKNFNNLDEQSWQWGFIHGDFHPGNFIFKKDKITGLFDFDQCGFGPLIWDVGFAHAHFGFHLHHTTHEEIRDYFLSSYRKCYRSSKLTDKTLKSVTAFAMAERLAASVNHFAHYPSKGFWKDEVSYYHEKLSELLI